MIGSVVYQYAFDVASEIETKRIRQVLGVAPAPLDVHLGTMAPRDILFYRPLAVSLKPEEADSNVGRITVRTSVKIYDVGVVSISFEVPFEKRELGELLPYHTLMFGEKTATARAEELLVRVVESIRETLVKPSTDRPTPEAYTLFCLSKLEGAAPGAVPDWAHDHRREIAALLSEEALPERLAPDQITDALRHSLSYTTSDLTVIDWDAALLVDQAGTFDDVLYVAEIANLQLEEYKLLDDRLDRFFQAAYDDLERYYARILSTPDKILRALRAIRMDITKMSEEATNITKFVGDWYLARVYLACKDRFHLGQWETSVDQKLAQLDNIYQLVHAEITNRRMLILEAIIVALFVFDVIVLIFGKK